MGGPWSKNGAQAGQIKLDGDGGAYFDSTPADLPNNWTIAPTVPAADYNVFAQITKLSAINGGMLLVARWVSADAWYAAGYQDLDGWNIYKADGAGGSVDLVDNPDTSWAVGRTRLIRLHVNEDSIRLYSDGVLVAETTDSDFAAAGRPGLAPLVYPAQPAPGVATGWHIDDWYVTYE